MANMFGVIVSGQLVQTDFQIVGEKQFLKTIEKAEVVNHIVVFLTGTMPFPDGFGGLVYFSLPDAMNPPAWHLLGYISNEKPSAIFKISGLKNQQRHLNADGSQFVFGLGAVSIEAQIGIAVDSIASIQQQCPTVNIKPGEQAPRADVQLCRRVLDNFVTFAMSYAVAQEHMTPNPRETYVPITALTLWHTSFERRLLQNPDFLWQD